MRPDDWKSIAVVVGFVIVAILLCLREKANAHSDTHNQIRAHNVPNPTTMITCQPVGPLAKKANAFGLYALLVPAGVQS
jgi:hypothetical protein